MKLSTHTTVAFQGEQGAFSEMAVLKLFGLDVLPEPTVSFRHVFEKVSTGVCEYGVVPIENSLGGVVYQVWDCLYDFNLSIVAETQLEIEQCLIVNPGTSIEDIKNVYSHYQPALQCSKFLQKHKEWTIVDAYDTAGSVKIIKELQNKGDKHLAAIASERAADVYKMTILEKGIQDSKQNITRFVVISKKGLETGNKFTTVLSLENKVGTLKEVLQLAFDDRINLTSIHSRPNKRYSPFSHIFFIEGVHDKNTPLFLIEIKRKFSDCKILGVYHQFLENVDIVDN